MCNREGNISQNDKYDCDKFGIYLFMKHSIYFLVIFTFEETHVNTRSKMFSLWLDLEKTLQIDWGGGYWLDEVIGS